MTARPGESLLRVAERLGIAIPRLCHADPLRPDGNCRACVVEIEGERVLAPSCCRAPTIGMKVSTASARAVKSRHMVLEMLLADMPDQGFKWIGGDATRPHGELSDWAAREGVTVRPELAALRRESAGAGPLEPLLALRGVTDVLVNGHRQVFLDRGAGLEAVDRDGDGVEHVLGLGRVQLAEVGRDERAAEAAPLLDPLEDRRGGLGDATCVQPVAHLLQVADLGAEPALDRVDRGARDGVVRQLEEHVLLDARGVGARAVRDPAQQVRGGGAGALALGVEHRDRDARILRPLEDHLVITLGTEPRLGHWRSEVTRTSCERYGRGARKSPADPDRWTPGIPTQRIRAARGRPSLRAPRRGSLTSCQ